jgi:hypothetical protein
MVGIAGFSCSSFYLETFCNGNLLSSATGFTFEYQSNILLCSNWHVFSGRDPENGQPLMKSGAIPDKLEILLPRKRLGEWKRKSIDLLDSDSNSLWFQHVSGQDVDLAGIKLEIPDECTHHSINHIPTTNDMQVWVGMEVFIIGFPLGNFGGRSFPIWKRASIASEPEVAPNDKKIILVDTASRSGMSGSPVIIHSAGNYISTDGNHNIGTGFFRHFIGIYSGRLGKNEFEAQLGIVWKKTLLDEMVQSQVPGNYVLRQGQPIA